MIGQDHRKHLSLDTINRNTNNQNLNLGLVLNHHLEVTGALVRRVAVRLHLSVVQVADQPLPKEVAAHLLQEAEDKIV